MAACSGALVLGGCGRHREQSAGARAPAAVTRRVAEVLRRDLSRHLTRWADTYVEGPSTYLDFARQPAAHCYRVMRDEVDVGYILTSVRRDEVPVQECGAMRAPHLRHLGAAKRVAETELKEGEALGSPTLLWPSAGMYYVLFEVLRGAEAVGDVTVYLRSLTVRRDRLYRLAGLAKGKAPSRGTVSTAKELWSRVDGAARALNQPKLAFIDGLPAYACTVAARPTSVVMWLSGMGLLANREPVEDVAELMPFMEHTLAGHPGWDISGGVRRFATARWLGASLKLYSRTNRAPTLKWHEYRGLIDARKFPLLGLFPRYHIGLPVGEELGVPFGVAAVGAGYYDHPAFGSFVITRDALFLDEEPAAERHGALNSAGTTFYAWRANTADLAALTLTTGHAGRA